VPYVKTSVRTTRSGTVRYLQLAHNEWDAEAQRSRTRILYNFGREDEVDKDQVRRLVSALSRLLDPRRPLLPQSRASWQSPPRGPWAARTRWTGCGAGWAWTR
jgi:hypothetical protein